MFLEYMYFISSIEEIHIKDEVLENKTTKFYKYDSTYNQLDNKKFQKNIFSSLFVEPHYILKKSNPTII